MPVLNPDRASRSAATTGGKAVEQLASARAPTPAILRHVSPAGPLPSQSEDAGSGASFSADASPAAAAAAPAPAVLLRMPHLFEHRPVKRKASIDRSKVEWSCIQITGSAETATPVGSCIFCGKHASWTSTRIKDHILGMNHSKACPAESEHFLETKAKLSGLRMDVVTKKQQLDAERRMNEASSSTGRHQTTIESSMNVMTTTAVDEAIARFFYGENISFRAVESTLFHEMIAVMRAAPVKYKPPNRKRLGGDLLKATTTHLRTSTGLVRNTILQQHGCTIMCDGWDDISKNHLVNLVYGTAAASFFEGTSELNSTTHEDAASVANFIIEGIDALAPPVASVVHVVTDTCSTMKAAWKIVEEHRPWVTATCCAPHVLNLLLKDFASIAEVAEVMAKMERVLHRFWGRSRWPRSKLLETTFRNHGKKLGLYRAKVTRFAGKYRQLARALRLKADLQMVVVCPEYSNKRFDDGADQLGVETVKAIVLDDDFWSDVVHVLTVAQPIVKLLFICDNQSKELMGKVYYHMFQTGESITKLRRRISWAYLAQGYHAARWEYLHSEMHAAGYALDPEFLYSGDGGELDDARITGLIAVVERLSIRYLIQHAVNPLEAATSLTVDSPQVQEHAHECMVQFARFRAKEGIFTKELEVGVQRIWHHLSGGECTALTSLSYRRSPVQF